MYGKYFVIFAIMFTGWFLRKINFIDDKMDHSINKLIVYFAYPCLIVHNIGGLEMDHKIITSFVITFALSLASFYLYGLICYGYARLRKVPESESNILEFSMIAPNDGFMGFPVLSAALGADKLMFSSDMPQNTPAELAIFRAVFTSREDLAKVLAGTALRVFDIPLA